MALESSKSIDEALSLYFDLKPNENVDLEVAAATAIEWCRALKAAAMAADPGYEYRVQLIEARVGSSNWLAKIQRSKANQAVERVKKGYEEAPLLVKLTAGLALSLVVTGVPTYEFYFGEKGFSDIEIEQLQLMLDRAANNEKVIEHRRSMYREVQQDPNIQGLGTGVVHEANPIPAQITPSTMFAEADGLFEIREDVAVRTRSTRTTLDVLLVTPQLINAKRAWVFRQPGLDGVIKAKMVDLNFLDALEKQEIPESLRINIPMTIVLEVFEENTGDGWTVKRRSVIEVLSPRPATDDDRAHIAKPK